MKIDISEYLINKFNNIKYIMRIINKLKLLYRILYENKFVVKYCSVHFRIRPWTLSEVWGAG